MKRIQTHIADTIMMSMRGFPSFCFSFSHANQPPWLENWIHTCGLSCPLTFNLIFKQFAIGRRSNYVYISRELIKPRNISDASRTNLSAPPGSPERAGAAARVIVCVLIVMENQRRWNVRKCSAEIHRHPRKKRLLNWRNTRKVWMQIKRFEAGRSETGRCSLTDRSASFTWMWIKKIHYHRWLVICIWNGAT